VYHLDLYRLNRPDELTNLGWDEIVNGNAVVLIEWPERAGDRLPRHAQRIGLEHLAGDPERRGLRTVGA
jgi:tRNA threonylcarbamoyladenosine biosynthesis protein TsaE